MGADDATAPLVALFADMRRFLWASVEGEGERLEHIGIAVELLIGFLAQSAS